MSSEREIVARGCWRYSQVRILETETTFVPSENQRAVIESKWVDRPTDIEDLPRWRLETIEANEELVLKVSKTSYKWHFILRNEDYGDMNKYPNP